MSTVARRETKSPLGELFDWLEEGFPVMAWRPGVTRVRVEDYQEDGRYVVRAELPGFDPEKEIEITVAGGVLSINAERHEEQKDKNRSEFHYGSFERRMTLPPGAAEEGIEATYDNGILTVTVPMSEPEPEVAGRRIPVSHGS